MAFMDMKVVRTTLEKELVTEKKSGGEVAPKWRVPNGG